MAAQLPNAHSIRQTMAAIESDRPPSGFELGELLASPGLSTGLDRWQLWTLFCLSRHLNRQKWVGYVVETRLKGDLTKLGRAGSMGHPEDMPQEGEVPDEPGWRYFFHGIGCCLTNKTDGTSIDVDFTEEGESERIDRFFYSNFLEELKRPDFPERVLQRKEPLQHAWQANIDALALAGCLNVERGIRITQLGRDLVDSLEPVLERLTELAREDSPLAARRLLYAALTLGDLILSRQVAERAELEGALTANIARAAEQTEQRRATQLIELLQTNSTGDKSALLAALADLGTIDAKRTVARYLLRTPVDGVANTALAILLYWNGPDAVKSLEDLIELRHAQAFGVRSRLSAILGAGSRKDKLPRGYQVVRAVIGLLQRSRPGSLKPALRGKILTLLEASGTANSGEAALLQYTLDTERGLNGLRTALSGTIPAAQCDSAAACVLLHTRPAEQILIEALDNPHLEIQHTAACALQRFPTAEARESAAHWFARLDGIDSPAGEEVQIAGRTITAYTFDDIKHANMEVFLSASIDRLRKDFGPILQQPR